MTNKFFDVNKDTWVIVTNIKPMNSHLSNKILMQQGIKILLYYIRINCQFRCKELALNACVLNEKIYLQV